MLLPKFVRSNIEAVEQNLKNRHIDTNLTLFRSLEEERLLILNRVQEKKSILNQASKEIGILKREKKEIAPEKFEDLKLLSNEIETIDTQLKQLEEQVQDFCLNLPNILAEDVVIGKDEEYNVKIRAGGKIKKFDFPIKSHADLGIDLNIMDFQRAVKISGSRFVCLRNAGAKLERALINFFLDENIQAGYEEIYPPAIVNKDSLIGTGQFPKFQEDVFQIMNEHHEYYLIPTAEVPVTNLYSNEILKEEELPLNFTAFTPCFRSEAGAAGKDTKGLIRQHQFNKVELVTYCKPENSEKQHLKMIAHIETLLQKLKLPYQLISLCSGDTGFSASKCYDFEVWLPSQQTYREISSCSNFTDFQSNRCHIRYKSTSTNKNIPIHTLNGSALAVGRTMVAILENYQNPDGSITVPKALVSYMGGQTKIEKT